MSSRNSQASKAAARERLRAQREKDVKKAKMRRQLTVGGGVVALLAIAGGVAVGVNQLNKPAYWENAAKQTLVKPAHATGPNGTTVIVGDPGAKKTLNVYEDMRCPYCAQYEQTSGALVQQYAKDGRFKISYTMGTFLDGNAGGAGSKKALSALGAALNVSTDAFDEYHTLLYSAKVHPEETVDAFNDADHLISLAQQIPALKGNTAFSEAVKKGTFDKWALTMSDKFNSSGVNGTPTVKLDGKAIPNPQNMSATQFKAALDSALAGS